MFRDLQATARRHALVALFVLSSFALFARASVAQDEDIARQTSCRASS